MVKRLNARQSSPLILSSSHPQDYSVVSSVAKEFYFLAKHCNVLQSTYYLNRGYYYRLIMYIDQKVKIRA